MRAPMSIFNILHIILLRINCDLHEQILLFRKHRFTLCTYTHTQTRRALVRALYHHKALLPRLLTLGVCLWFSSSRLMKHLSAVSPTEAAQLIANRLPY